jgi:hypothetical protein
MSVELTFSARKSIQSANLKQRITSMQHTSRICYRNFPLLMVGQSFRTSKAALEKSSVSSTKNIAERVYFPIIAAFYPVLLVTFLGFLPRLAK